jgi:hypothetical protein
MIISTANDNNLYFADRTMISGAFSESFYESGVIHFTLSFGENQVVVSCRERWNSKKILEATRDIVNYINSYSEIEIFQMLKDAGFPRCEPL